MEDGKIKKKKRVSTNEKGQRNNWIKSHQLVSPPPSGLSQSRYSTYANERGMQMSSDVDLRSGRPAKASERNQTRNPSLQNDSKKLNGILKWTGEGKIRDSIRIGQMKYEAD